MTDLLHRIRVFVFQVKSHEPDYLLLRGSQGIESFWGPIQGNIGFGEKLESAIRREVMDDVGILSPIDLIDLQMPNRLVMGDEEIIEWTFGLRTAPTPSPLRLDPRWAEFRWVQFSEAYPTLELDVDRAAIMRLHTLLRAA
ncbi:MAG: NUDIX domain-containing protein [Planctomycetota bacterium]